MSKANASPRWNTPTGRTDVVEVDALRIIRRRCMPTGGPASGSKTGVPLYSVGSTVSEQSNGSQVSSSLGLHSRGSAGWDRYRGGELDPPL